MLKLGRSNINFGPIFIGFAAFLWATDAFARSELGDDIGGLQAAQLVLIEHLIIILVITPFAFRFLPELKNYTGKEWFALLFVGIGGSALATVAFTRGFFYGFTYIPVVILLQQTQPIIAIGLASILLKEKLPPLYYIYAAMAVIGVFLIYLPFYTGGSNNPTDISGVIDNLSTNTGSKAGFFGLLAAVLWGSSTVFGRYVLQHGKNKPEYLQMTAYRFYIGFIFLAIVTSLSNSVLSFIFTGYPSRDAIFLKNSEFLILYIALIPGLVSLLSYYYGLKTTHASISTIFELVFPLSAFVVIPIMQQYRDDVKMPETIQLIGGALILIASTLISYNYGKLQAEYNVSTKTSSQIS